jgi:Na+/melibiose symporter-like transporter
VISVQPFLAVFLTRLGATNLQVGLLSAMPGVTGLFLALILGRFLQSRRDIVPWYSGARAIAILAYALTGVISLLLPQSAAIPAILGLWMLVTLPQTMLSVAFSVVMNAIAGPKGRYALMSRRWSTIGLTSALMTIVVGQILERVRFPLNYQLVFIGVSLAGLAISYAGASRFELPSQTPPSRTAVGTARERLRLGVRRILAERAFVTITLKRLVFILGSQLVIPLFSLYYVRELQASDAAISLINTVQRAVLLIGYFVWTRVRERRGTRFVLLSTTLAVALYPALTAFTRQVGWMVVLAGAASVFQAGLNLVLFDELMRTIPVEDSATFVAVAQSLQHVVVIVGPLLSTTLSESDYIGLSGALLLGAGVRLVGFAWFLLGGGASRRAQTATE